jgi:hypothetical protein
VVASIAFGPNELPGFLSTQSDRHLLVIIGFTSTGDEIVNDPTAGRQHTWTKVKPQRTVDWNAA